MRFESPHVFAIRVVDDRGVHRFFLEAMDSDSVKSFVVIGIRALRI